MTKNATTYTVLVTIAHEGEEAPEAATVAAMIERGLEEGVREYRPTQATIASAIQGDWVANQPQRIPEPVKRAKRIHAAVQGAA